MSEYRYRVQIEKGIIIPLAYFKRRATTNYRGSRPKYPFDNMEVGDSFRLTVQTDAAAKNVRESSTQYGGRRNQKFAVTRDDKFEYRCWRLE